MKNFLGITFVLLLLAATGSTATLKQRLIGGFGGPVPTCGDTNPCMPPQFGSGRAGLP